MTKESPKPKSTTAESAAPRRARPELKLVTDEPSAATESGKPASRFVAQFRAMADALDLEIEAIMNL